MHQHPDHEFSKIDGYNHLTYAFLCQDGIIGLFDTLRYERAFFAQRKDVQWLIENCDNREEIFLKHHTFVLGKFHWSAKQDWTTARLLSSQHLSYLTTDRFIEFGIDPIRKLKPSCRTRVDCRVVGDLPRILTIMYNNRAMPATEGASHLIEGAFCNEPWHLMNVQLTTFKPKIEPFDLSDTLRQW